ncbi:hypothetical protein DSTSK_30560 [Desulforhabdus sp. TSK]|nr:hypothetical protein DSTSK_30560 [Desulforhabdus sp. TSK]
MRDGKKVVTMSKPSNKAFETGTVLNDKWVILEFIGKGGMGEVYRAHQLNLNRDAAIKVISKEFVKSLEGDTEAMTLSLDRFRREVQLMAQVRHMNVLQIFDHGSITASGTAEGDTLEYIAMEYIAGGTLRDTMSEEGFFPEEGRMREWIQNLFMPLLNGVQAMHEAGIIHRDLKPENILLDGKIPKIADFGLARSCRLKPFTQSMDMRGTPPYMSPEHFFDLKRTDERTDVYALGKILFEAVVGKMKPDQIPFKQASLPNPQAPFFVELDRIIRSATTEEKNERTPTVEALKNALVGLLGGAVQISASPSRNEGIKKRHFKALILWSAAVLFLTAAIGLGILIFHEGGHTSTPSQTTSPTLPTLGEIFEAEIPPLLSAKGAPPAPTFHAKDGTVLRLIPGGKITTRERAGEGTGRSYEVAPFYMDETKVTNYQYVEFLNRVLPRIEVKNGVVRGDGKIWLLLGEVTKGCDPIGYEEGRFMIKEPVHSACPVLRVTPYGALAYTRFFSMRIPTEAEWLVVLDEEAARSSKASFKGTEKENWMMMEGQHPQPEAGDLPLCSPVGLFKANAHGIRGLNAGGEWGLRGDRPSSAETGQPAEFVALGGFLNDSESGDGLAAAIKRFPWEAFEEVGFRCVVSAPVSGG